jgi:hypothetical protein
MPRRELGSLASGSSFKAEREPLYLPLRLPPCHAPASPLGLREISPERQKRQLFTVTTHRAMASLTLLYYIFICATSTGPNRRDALIAMLRT